MQFVASNVAEAELDSTSATVARNDAKKVALCVRALRRSSYCFLDVILARKHHSATLAH